jgi:hypothetical protein
MQGSSLLTTTKWLIKLIIDGNNKYYCFGDVTFARLQNVYIYIDQCHTQRFFVAKEIGFLLNQLKKSCNNDHKIMQCKTSYGIGMDGMVPKVISKWRGKL